MILITGASGNVGSAVLNALTAKGQPVRALYRSAEDVSRAPRKVETAVADFANKTALRQAMQGISKVFLVCSPMPQLVDLESNVVDVSREAGIEHLVQNSAMGAGVLRTSFPSWHYQVEQKIKDSGVPFTILRPNTFMQNVVQYFAPTIRTQNAFYACMNNSRVSLIDVRDIAEVVATVLSTSGHERQVYELNGPEALTYTEVASRISRVIGRNVKYINLTAEQLTDAMVAAGLPKWQADALVELQSYYTSGHGGETDNVVQGLIGRTPIGFDEFLSTFTSSFKAEPQVA